MGLYSLSGFSRSSVYSGFSIWDCTVCLVSAGLRFTQGSVDGTVKSVCFLRSSVYSGFSRCDYKVCLVSAGLRFTQGSVDGTVKSVWFQQVFGLLRVQYIGL
jgi:hypothetical protein